MSRATYFCSNLSGKQSKTSNPDGKDYISKLPGDILSHILSRLPIKDAVKTCVLSKNWEFKWTSIYNLKIISGELSCKCSKSSTVVNILERLLVHVQNVKNFQFECSCNKKSVLGRISTLISAVLRRGVECFELKIHDNDDFLVPRSLLSCTSLRKLNLHFETPCCFRVPGKICFPNLESLYLHSVRFLNEISGTDTLIFSFPVLKVLVLEKCKWVNVKFVELHAPSLRRFTSISPFEFDYMKDVDYTIKVIGATISQLFIYGGYPENIIMIDSTVASALVGCLSDYLSDPAILRECGFQIRKLLREISNLKSLLLFSGFWAFGQTYLELPLPRFSELKRIVTEKLDSVEGLLELLHAAPFLKSLEINLGGDLEDYDYDSLECLPSCVEHNLEIVMFNYDHCPRPNFLLEKFLLKNGKQLQKVIISNCDELERKEMVEKVLKFPKASATLKIKGLNSMYFA